MLNVATLVGRLENDLILEETKNNKKILNIQLSVPRAFKNTEGNYDTDHITITLFGDTAVSTHKYVKKGDMVGVKARLQNLNPESNLSALVAEKVTFLSPAKNEA